MVTHEAPPENVTIENMNAVGGELPPSYETVESTQTPTPAEPPPTYQSLFGDLQRTRKESNGMLEFFKNLAIFFFSTIGFLICLAILLAIPISCIVIGVEYKDDCTIEPKIPLYLIVFGVFGVLRNMIGIFNKGKKRLNDEEDSEDSEDPKKATCEGMIDCFLFAWFICGNVWVYHNYMPNLHDKHSPQYCHQTLYLFAFWLNTAFYILLGTSCCCFCCIGCIIAMFSDEE